MERITIKDIAEEAGVSRGTVDRVINDRGGVADKTKKKVVKKIKELNYTPNRVARSLALQKTYDIFVIVPQEPGSFYRKVKDGIKDAQEQFQDFGLNVRVLSEEDNREKEEELFKYAIKEKADGIAILALNTDKMRRLIDKAVTQDIPVLTFISDVADSKRFCYIGLDNFKGGRLAGELMGKMLNGSGQVAVMVNYVFNSCNYQRRKGFTQVINESYNNIEITKVVENCDNNGVAYSLAVNLVENFPRLEGIFVTNASSPGVARALEDLNREGEIRLIGFDVTESVVNYLKKEVIYATISQEPYNQGYRAVSCMFDYILEGETPENQNILTMPKPIFKENI